MPLLSFSEIYSVQIHPFLSSPFSRIAPSAKRYVLGNPIKEKREKILKKKFPSLELKSTSCYYYNSLLLFTRKYLKGVDNSYLLFYFDNQITFLVRFHDTTQPGFSTHSLAFILCFFIKNYFSSSQVSIYHQT